MIQYRPADYLGHPAHFRPTSRLLLPILLSSFVSSYVC